MIQTSRAAEGRYRRYREAICSRGWWRNVVVHFKGNLNVVHSCDTGNQFFLCSPADKHCCNISYTDNILVLSYYRIGDLHKQEQVCNENTGQYFGQNCLFLPTPFSYVSYLFPVLEMHDNRTGLFLTFFPFTDSKLQIIIKLYLLSDPCG